MPATVKHIETNLTRIQESGDSELIKLLDGIEAEDKFHLWKQFVSAADKAKVADRIPGTVGREYAKKYGKAKARPRGARREVALTPAAVKAVEAYIKPSDGVSVENSALVYTSQRKAEAAVEAMIARSRRDIERDAKTSAAMRTSLTALQRKVGVADSTAA